MAEFLTDAQMAELEKKQQPKQLPKFISDADMAALESSGPNISQKESFLRGAGQGATLGFGDELAGQLEKSAAPAVELAGRGIKSLAELVGYKGGADLGTKMIQTAGGIENQSVKDIISENRAENRQAQEANPWSYGGGQVVGSIPITIATSGANKYLQAASLGSLTGLGMSEEDTSSGRLKDAVTGGAIGTLATLGGDIVGKGAKYAGKVGKKALASIRNIKPESLETLAARPQDVQQAVQMIKDNTYVPTVAENLNKKIQDFVSTNTKQIDNLLANSNKKISTVPIKKFISDQVDDLGKIQITPLRVRQTELLKQQQALVDQLPETMSASEFNVIKKQIQEQAKSAFKDAGISSDSLSKMMLEFEESVRNELNRAVPGVKDINARLSKAIKLQEKIGLKNAFKGDAMDPAKLQSFLKTLGNDAKKQLMSSVEQFDELMGTNIVDASRVFRAADDIYGAQSGDIFSAYKTGKSLLGPGLGGAAGSLFGPIGTAIGTGAGLAVQSPAATVPLMKLGGAAGTFATKQLPPIIQSSIPGLTGAVMNEKGRKRGTR